MELLFFALFGFFLLPFAIGTVTGYYRQPDIHGNVIVFNSEGDLWIVPATGGDAYRITTHLGQEEWPVISHDGTCIAFSANYDGSRDAYVIPIKGGRPERISWDGARPVGWTPDGEVLLTTRSYSGLPNQQLITISPKSKEVVRIPLAQAAEGSFTEEGVLFFARLPKQGSNSRWYKGGTAQKLWKFQDGLKEAIPLTNDYPGTSRQTHRYGRWAGVFLI